MFRHGDGGRLIFEDSPLSEVVADLERHRQGWIIIADDRIRNITVTAVFDSRRADAALDAISDTLPVRLTRIGGVVGRTVRLRLKPPCPADSEKKI